MTVTERTFQCKATTGATIDFVLHEDPHWSRTTVGFAVDDAATGPLAELKHAEDWI